MRTVFSCVSPVAPVVSVTVGQPRKSDQLRNGSDELQDASLWCQSTALEVVLSTP